MNRKKIAAAMLAGAIILPMPQSQAEPAELTPLLTIEQNDGWYWLASDNKYIHLISTFLSFTVTLPFAIKSIA